MNAVAVKHELFFSAAIVSNICLPAQTLTEFPRKPPPPSKSRSPQEGHLKSIKEHISSICPLYLNTLISSCPVSPLCLTSTAWSLAQCFLATNHPKRVLPNLRFRQHGKSRGWFASSGTGGVVYNCGAIVEVNVKSMDGARILASSTIPQGVM